MKAESYYRDHWVEIEPDRLEAYDQMFEWRPQMAPLLAPADLKPGHVVVDYGCGPGGLAVELARRVGPEGHVHGVDLNPKLLERARVRAERDGVSPRISWHHAPDDRIPLEDASADRLVCKNVLEYVTDVGAILAEFHRVLRPGGMAHLIDSDWGMLVVEPLGPERVAELFDAARVAYKTPLIGRRLYGALRNAGFQDVQVSLLASADTKGFAAPVLHNMASYARAAGELPEARIEAFLRDVDQALKDETYLLVLPQFLATGTR